VANFSSNFQVNFSMSEEVSARDVASAMVQAYSLEPGIVPSAPREQSTLAHVQGRVELAQMTVLDEVNVSLG
jgi:hypothetical protein